MKNIICIFCCTFSVFLTINAFGQSSQITNDQKIDRQEIHKSMTIQQNEAASLKNFKYLAFRFEQAFEDWDLENVQVMQNEVVKSMENIVKMNPNNSDLQKIMEDFSSFNFSFEKEKIKNSKKKVKLLNDFSETLGRVILSKD